MQIRYQPIGIVHSPFQAIEDMPIQPRGATGVKGEIELLPEFSEGLKDLDGFSHIIALYHFHRVRGYRLTVMPFLDDQPHGIFATRAPKRPNPLGLSVLRLRAVEGNRLLVENIDILDGTPVIDIKPYVPEFDQPGEARTGWLEKARGQVDDKRSDDRFG